MRILCPRCKTSSSLPASREGAKVRCGECGRVFAARPPGAKGARSGKGPPLGVVLGLGVLVVVLGLYLIVGRGSETPARAEQKSASNSAPMESSGPAVETHPIGWDGACVQFAVQLHGAVHAGDRQALAQLLHGPTRWAREESERSGAEIDPGRFLTLSRAEREGHTARWVEDLMLGESSAFIAAFEPYDGEVTELTDKTAVVLLKVTARAAGVTDQHTVRWDLVQDLGGWKAHRWEQHLTAAERLELERDARKKAVQKVVLSDGSKVFEREPEPLEHLEDTAHGLRDEIDSLYGTMMDLDLTREASAARRRIIAIGRPALPKLLTGLYETPLNGLDDAIQVNMIVVALREITGRHMGFEPQTLIGAGLGTSEEHRTSAIKQWFAWWYLHRDTFTEKEPEVDVLDEMIELSEREKRWLERDSNK